VLATLAERGTPVPARAIAEGFAAARWPGRLEPCPAAPGLWWDAAHNADGMATLARAWREDLRLPPPAALAVAIARDKDAAAMLGSLRALAPGARLFATRTHSPRALEPDALLAHARAAGFSAVAMPDVATAARAALDWAGKSGGLALLAGSLFAVGEAMEALGGAPGEQA
jgi:dihydrofolate synthase/folylpolyglutamate synthase